MKLYITLESDDTNNKIENVVNITTDTNIEALLPIIEDMVTAINNLKSK